jgi:hypothetical protein
MWRSRSDLNAPRGRLTRPDHEEGTTVPTATLRTHLTGAGLGTLDIRSAVGDSNVTITYEVPASQRSTSSRGSTLDGEPVGSGRLVTDTWSSSWYETDLSLADLEPGDHIYTVAATIGGTLLTGSTIFTTPAA